MLRSWLEGQCTEYMESTALIAACLPVVYDQYIPGNILGFNYWDGCYFTGTSTSTTKIGVRKTIGKQQAVFTTYAGKQCGCGAYFLEKLFHPMLSDALAPVPGME